MHARVCYDKSSKFSNMGFVLVVDETEVFGKKLFYFLERFQNFSSCR
jgi:hypothetical protein